MLTFANKRMSRKLFIPMNNKFHSIKNSVDGDEDSDSLLNMVSISKSSSDDC